MRAVESRRPLFASALQKISTSVKGVVRIDLIDRFRPRIGDVGGQVGGKSAAQPRLEGMVTAVAVITGEVNGRISLERSGGIVDAIGYRTARGRRAGRRTQRKVIDVTNEL